MNIAFVSREIAGLHKNGGIGTAVRHACENLARLGGHQVHVYHTGRPSLRMLFFTKEMKTLGINMHSMPLISCLTRSCRKRAAQTFAFLKTTRHDVYIFHEFMGDGFFCFHGKKKGEAFADSPLGIITHGSSLWVDEGNGHVHPDARRLELYDMERACCELADFLVSPSDFLLEWMRGRSWVLPPLTRRIANFSSSPGTMSRFSGQRWLAPSDIREIVFFGRLEERKGVRVFCDALNMISAHLLAERKLVFLGKEDHFRADDVRALLQPTLRQGNVPLHFFTRYDTMQARAYLCREGVLAVMPSLLENSPCAVSECLEDGVPFLASSSGGGKELLCEEDREAALFAPRKEVLAARLTSILSHEGIRVSRPAQTQESILQSWQTLLQDLPMPR